MWYNKRELCHQFNEGDTVYILGKYGYGWEYPLCVVEAKVAYYERKRWYAYGVHDNSTWSFPTSYYNYSVFTDKEKAIERINAENDFYLDEYPEESEWKL